jgi:L-arabinonolactonase
MSGVRLAVDARNQLGECVLWCDRTERIWWTDIQRATLWCCEPAAGRTHSWKMPERLGSFALTESEDTLLLGLESMLAFYQLSTGAVEPICAVEPELGSTRINDGRCDRRGNFVFGTLNEDRRRERIGSFYRLDPGLHLEKLPLGGVAIPNSICFSPDRARMYYCDSTEAIIRCCDYGPRLEDIRNDRVFVELEAGPGSPDGSTVDSNGGVWNAQWGGARVVRYTPDGRTDRVVAIPTSQPSCVCFGGKDLNHLYVTTARDELPDSVLETEPLAGGLFCAALTGLHGIPEGRFGGSR